MLPPSFHLADFIKRFMVLGCAFALMSFCLLVPVTAFAG
jgi:hypothetical protein